MEYASQYEGIQGIRHVRCPFPQAKILQFNDQILRKPGDLRESTLEESWLAKLQVLPTN
jgi:hypothetical protein